MIAVDNDALICDFAEYYNIKNYRELEPQYAAVLASGLSPDSRIMRKITGQKYSIQTILLAHLVDSMALNNWMQTKDGKKNNNRPKSIVSVLVGESREYEDTGNSASFSSPEDFEAAKRRIIEEDNNG